MLTENFKQNVSKDLRIMKDNPGISLTALAIAYLVGKGAGTVIKETLEQTPPKTNIPFEFVSMDDNEMTLKQNGKEYTLKINKLPEEVKDSLIEQNPNLRSFLTNGPINIIN